MTAGFKSMSDIIGAELGPEELAAATVALVEQNFYNEEKCARCEKKRRDIGATGLCEPCLSEQSKTQWQRKKIRFLPESLRMAELDDLTNVGNVAKVKEQLRDAARAGGSVYHHGGCGCGKSTMHAALYRALIGAGKQATWKHQRQFLAQKEADERLIDKLVHQACNGVLFIDELGEPVEKKWNIARLSMLIDELYLRRGRARVWFTSNYSPANLGRALTAPGFGLDPESAGRIVSRIMGMARVVHNEAGDWRLNGMDGVK